MVNNNFNILPKLSGKYFHKAVRLIVLGVVFPAILIITFLIVFANEKLTNFLSVLMKL